MNYFIQFIVIVTIATLFSVAGSVDSVRFLGIPLFALCVGFSLIVQWLVFIPSYLFQTEHYFDLTGSLTYLSVVLIGISLTEPAGLSVLLGTLVGIWALRLGTFLFLRVKSANGDKRFKLKNKFGWFFIAWTLQGLWVVLTSGAAIVVITATEQAEMDIYSIPGFCLWVVGFTIEVIADRQKTDFRRRPENKDRFIRSGLWAYSRHPNYFGEIVLWFGISAMAMPVLKGWQLITLISPLFVWVLLRYVSGVPFLEEPAKEKWGEEMEYQEYLKNTPAIFPNTWRRHDESESTS